METNRMTTTLKPRRDNEVWAFPGFGRMFDDFFTARMAPQAERMLRPAMDVEEDADKIVVRTELAGIPKEDVSITLEDGVLTIAGEKKSDREMEDKNYHLVERSFGSFHRSITLPSGVDSEKAEASFENGILSIAIPKAEAAKPRKLEIQ